MVTKRNKDTEMADSKPEGNQEEATDPEQSREPSPEKPTDTDTEKDTEAGAGTDAASGTSEDSDSLDDSDEGHDDFSDLPADTGSAGGFAAGAAAVVSAALGLSSLVGTSLSDMLRSRREIIGQIETGGGGGGDQIEAFYGAPWHTAALVNSVFALIALAIGGVLLAVLTGRADTRPWVKSVALGGVILGVLGLLVAAGMYFDLFAAAPTLPGAPS
ncbi:hypothetical protein [Streptomyces gobiensis]|uniref:hypothetical protein n=1 Tax=Streptomyces gobiensis TaxID=2875706 RepID=UPI001E38B393|nr:hypothetical protein [Streptomyces gobiensis]UGY92294.1 hypothetical protein test1122_11500 [Streptomyces gobiensis]